LEQVRAAVWWASPRSDHVVTKSPGPFLNACRGPAAPDQDADLPPLFDAGSGGPRRLAEAIDTVRERHGTHTVQRGRGLAAVPAKPPSSTDPLPEGE